MSLISGSGRIPGTGSLENTNGVRGSFKIMAFIVEGIAEYCCITACIKVDSYNLNIYTTVFQTCRSFFLS